MTEEPILIGSPVLSYLKIDKVTLLELDLNKINGVNSKIVGNPTTKDQNGFFSRFLKAISEGKSEENRSPTIMMTIPAVDYRQLQAKKDSFPDPAQL